MDFTANIYFRGILGVVPEPTTASAVPKKLALLVPATDYEVPKDCDLDLSCAPESFGLDPMPEIVKVAADFKPLRRHRWFVEFDARQLDPPASHPASCLSHWIVSSPGTFHRMVFKTPEDANLPPLDVQDALDYVIDFAVMAPSYAAVPPAYLTWSPGPDVAGQIMFDKGNLIPPSPGETSQWTYPPTLRLPNSSKVQLAGTFSHRIQLQFENITSLTIEVRTGESEIPESLTLKGTPTEPVEVSICNLCDMNPLRWPTALPLRIDDDYRWYYELSQNKSYLPLDLIGLDLPVPHPYGHPGGVGQNCLETKYLPAPFTI